MKLAVKKIHVGPNFGTKFPSVLKNGVIGKIGSNLVGDGEQMHPTIIIIILLRNIYVFKFYWYRGAQTGAHCVGGLTRGRLIVVKQRIEIIK